MSGTLTFLIGGARSGKSTLALRLAEAADSSGTPVTFAVTAVPFDDDLRERVRRHRDERPPHWHTVECPVELANGIDTVPADHFLVVDCLTLFLANLMAAPDAVPHRVSAHIDALLAALVRRRERGASTVVVSNEVGMGIHPDTELGRVYRDDLGRLNQAVAAIADHSLLMVAGRALPLSDPMELLQ